ncbi:FecCD family ABC transporter permease [Dermabacteraceae bacterium P7054]
MPAAEPSATAKPQVSDAHGAYLAYRRRTTVRVGILLALAAVVAVVFVYSLTVGPIPFTFSEVLHALFNPGEDSQLATVVNDLRLPPALIAVLVGAALSLAGMQMQTILNNPLAEPFTLGISAAAALGASVMIVTGIALPVIPHFTLPVAATVAALAASGTIAAVARMRSVTKETVVLLGIALVFTCQALLALMQYRATTESLQQIVFWSMGSTMRGTWPAVYTVGLALLVATPLFWINGWRLTAITLGDSRAAAMGVNISAVRSWTLIGVSVLAALSVAFVGIIGFIGLVGPHIARSLVGEDQRFLIPASLLTGAALLSGAHVASQLLVPGVALPVGIVTALVGVPVFLSILLQRHRSALKGAA